MLINKIILTLIFAGIYSVANAQNINALDDNNGFQNYKFGMHMNQFQNCDFETVEDGGAERCIIRRMHLIGDIEARSVVLFFVDSNLSKIKVNFDAKFSDQLKEALNSAFGSSTSSNYSREFGWSSIHNDRKYFWEANNIKLLYNYRPSTYSFGYHVAGILYLEYSLNNYDELQSNYRSKKYTPSDF